MVTCKRTLFLCERCFLDKPGRSQAMMRKEVTHYESSPDGYTGIMRDSTRHYGFSPFDDVLVLWGDRDPCASCGGGRE